MTPLKYSPVLIQDTVHRSHRIIFYIHFMGDQISIGKNKIFKIWHKKWQNKLGSDGLIYLSYINALWNFKYIFSEFLFLLFIEYFLFLKSKMKHLTNKHNCRDRKVYSIQHYVIKCVSDLRHVLNTHFKVWLIPIMV